MTEQEHHDQRPEWLKTMAEKTWNLEMIISGTATYITSFLPRLTDQGLYFFLDNVNEDPTLRSSTFPLLAYCFAKVIAWLLPTAFIIHFIMRAFWAGLVGLHTVYPAGIRYDYIPGVRQNLKEIYRQRLGTLANYIQRLDRQCNQVFAVAFLIVLFGLGISLMYLIIFGISYFLPVWLGRERGELIAQMATYLFICIALLMFVAQRALGEITRESHPKWHKITTSFLFLMPNIIMPFIYNPVTYLNLAFSTNIPKRRYYVILSTTIMLVFSGFLFVFVSTIKSIRQGSDGLVAQAWYGNYQNDYSFRNNSYRSLTELGERTGNIVIPEEVVTGPFLKVFVAYPKWMDVSLRELCTVATAPDSLPKKQQRIWADSLKADCFRQHLTLMINDSVYQNAGWMFTRQNGTERIGLMAMPETTGFRNGKNTIEVRVPTPGNPDSLTVLDRVPFWYSTYSEK